MLASKAPVLLKASVFSVTEQGMSYACEMRPYLMSSSRYEIDLKQGK